MRRFLPVRAVRGSLSLLAVMIVVLVTGPAAASGAVPKPADTAMASAASCTSATAATYHHTFDGPAGIVTIRADRPLCAGQAQAFTLVSYTTGAPSSASGQFVYDSATATITARRRSVTLDVAVPACFARVDAALGAAVRTEATDAGALYDTATLGSATGVGSRSSGHRAWFAGGSTACTATATVSFQNACDGSFTATLANDSRANTQAVFLTGGRRIRLSPGRSTTVRAARNSTVTIRTNTFTTYVGTWLPPATPCAAVAPPTPGRVAAPAASTPRRVVAAPVAATTATGALGNTASDLTGGLAAVALGGAEAGALGGAGTGALGGALGGVGADAAGGGAAAEALSARAGKAALADRTDNGPGIGSSIATVAGLAMIGAGVAVLTRLRRTRR